MSYFRSTPFPLLVVQSALSNEALTAVRQEAEAIWTANLFRSETPSGVDNDGRSLRTGTAVFLDGLYCDRSSSSIIYYTEQLLMSDVWEQTEDDWFLAPTFRHSNFHSTLVNAYLSGQEYKAHQDESQITFILSFSGSDSIYQGGDLAFPDHAVTVPNADNQLIIFPSVVRHQVTPIVCEPTGNPVRYSVALFIGYSRV